IRRRPSANIWSRIELALLLASPKPISVRSRQLSDQPLRQVVIRAAFGVKSQRIRSRRKYSPRWFPRAPQFLGRDSSVSAVNESLQPQRARCERPRDVAQIARGQRTGHDRVVRHIAKWALQQGLMAHQPALHIDGADMVPEQRTEDREKPAERFGKVGKRVGIEWHGEV